MIPLSKILLNRGSCQALAVATLEEAIELRRQFNRPFTILVLSGFLPHQIEAYYNHNLVPVIHSLVHLRSLTAIDQLPPIHLKIDTGMNRLGIKPDQMDLAIQTLKKLPDKLAGLASHFADSEDVNSGFVEEQYSLFEYWHRELTSKKLLHTDARIHVANSGGILRKKGGITTAVRPGVGLKYR